MRYRFTNEIPTLGKNYYIYILIGLAILFIFMMYKINKPQNDNVIFLNDDSKKYAHVNLQSTYLP